SELLCFDVARLQPQPESGSDLRRDQRRVEGEILAWNLPAIRAHQQDSEEIHEQGGVIVAGTLVPPLHRPGALWSESVGALLVLGAGRREPVRVELRRLG